MKIEILGKFYDNHSLAIVNREMALGLSKLTDVCITPLDTFTPGVTSNEKIKILKELENKQFEEPDIQIRHSYPPIFRWPVSSKTKVIYIQPWEFSKVPMEWQYKFETFADHVICPSKWNHIRYVEYGLHPNKISIIPNGYDPTVFYPRDKKEVNNKYNINLNKYIFMYLGNAQHRKGIDILLQVWGSLFKKYDKALLIIKDTPSIYGNSNLLDEITKMQFKTKCAEIVYIDDDLNENEISDLYNLSNVLVHPYRGEGFGMHVQEAMACGIPPIVTANGSTDDFVDDSNGFRIHSRANMGIDPLSPKIFAGKPGDSFTGMGSHSWMLEPDLEHLKVTLHNLYFHSEREIEIQKKKDNLSKNLNTWENVAKLYLEVCQTVYNREGPTQREKWSIA